MNWILATLQASIAFFDAWMSQFGDNELCCIRIDWGI